MGALRKKYFVFNDCENDVIVGDAQHISHLLCFGYIFAGGMVIEPSEKPEGGLTKLVLPFIPPQKLSDVFTGLGKHEQEYTPEPLLNALAAITYRVAESIDPSMIDKTHVKMKRHKAEVQEELGLLWFNKACSSNKLEPDLRLSRGGWHSSTAPLLRMAVQFAHCVFVCKRPHFHEIPL